MPHLVLKVDVDTLRGTFVGVPALADVLRKHAAKATLLFSLGPNNTDRTRSSGKSASVDQPGVRRLTCRRWAVKPSGLVQGIPHSD